jgi:DNA-binding NarL/FixJ family response regulator
MTAKTRVVLVDDHALVRAGVRLLLNAQPDLEVVGEAGQAAEVLPISRQHQPDVVVLDLSLPGGPSLPLIRELQALGSHPQVLILSMHDDPAYVRAALGAGARGYVVKTLNVDDLLQAIRDVARGRLVIDLDDPELTASVFQTIGRGRPHEVGRSRLSQREEQVLRLLSQGHSNLKISEQLDLSPKTVATYRARLSEKLGLKTTADFVRYAQDVGLGSPSPAGPQTP